MKILNALKDRSFPWYFLILFLIFIILRAPSLIEPYWYGDEGIYQVIGQAMNNGALLYRDTWDNKPPLLYIVYALADGNQLVVRTVSLIAGLLSLGFLLALSQKLFRSSKITFGISLIYTILFATPLIEGNIANAENFLLTFTLAGAYLIYSTSPKQTLPANKLLITAGMLLGLGFLLKIVALFDFAAFCIFLFFISITKYKIENFVTSLHKLIPFLVGFMIPLTVTVIYFALFGELRSFFSATFLGNVGYVGWKNEFLGIPQGFLIFKSVLLFITVLLLVIFKIKISKTSFFILLWLVFSLFSTFFSGRPYTHYVLMSLPAYTLLIGLCFQKYRFDKVIGIILLILVTSIIVSFFTFYRLEKTIKYYNFSLQYLNGKVSQTSFQTFFDRKVPRDYLVAEFITTHTQKDDKVFIWGNNPQIYALAHKTPITKYTVAYHVSTKESFTTTQKALDTIKPKYIIVLKENEPLPFRIPLYIMRFSLEGATVYERNF